MFSTKEVKGLLFLFPGGHPTRGEPMIVMSDEMKWLPGSLGGLVR